MYAFVKGSLGGRQENVSFDEPSRLSCRESRAETARGAALGRPALLNIGCHLSSAKGYEHMGKTALEIGANTFQFFTRNPRGGSAKPFDPKDAAALEAIMREHSFAPLLAHAPYTLNACAADLRVRDFAHLAMSEDLETLERLPGVMYNFHPGSHVGQGVDEGIRLIADLLNRILRPELSTPVLLETMSGKGSEVGGTFEELARIFELTELSEKVGVCLDTCHVYAAGYDIVNDLDGVLRHFDGTVGLDRLRAVHLNDSMMPFGSHKDRHARIGEGVIGEEALARLINHPRLRRLPFLLETPNEPPGYAAEIAMLKAAYRE